MSHNRSQAEMLLWYQEQISTQTTMLHRLNRGISLFSWLRLTAFVLLLAFVTLFALYAIHVFLFLSALALIALIVLIVRHQQLYRRRDAASTLLQIQQNEVDSIHGRGNFYACFFSALGARIMNRLLPSIFGSRSLIALSPSIS